MLQNEKTWSKWNHLREPEASQQWQILIKKSWRALQRSRRACLAWQETVQSKKKPICFSLDLAVRTEQVIEALWGQLSSVEKEQTFSSQTF